MPFKMSGIDAMQATLKRAASRFPDEVAQAMVAEAKIELQEAKRRTPVDTGALQASGEISSVQRNGRSIEVDITFGNSDVDYAVIVHEDLEANHPNGGQAKYLESVLKESAPHMSGRIARRIDLNKVVK